jgi:hypothetical protein
LRPSAPFIGVMPGAHGFAPSSRVVALQICLLEMESHSVYSEPIIWCSFFIVSLFAKIYWLNSVVVDCYITVKKGEERVVGICSEMLRFRSRDDAFAADCLLLVRFCSSHILYSYIERRMALSVSDVVIIVFFSNVIWVDNRFHITYKNRADALNLWPCDSKNGLSPPFYWATCMCKKRSAVGFCTCSYMYSGRTSHLWLMGWLAYSVVRICNTVRSAAQTRSRKPIGDNQFLLCRRFL